MNKLLPVFLIVAVILFGAAGAVYVAKSQNGEVMGLFGGKKPEPTVSSNSAMMQKDEGMKKEVVMVKPTESVLANFIPLTVTYPKPAARVVLDKLTVTGKTAPNADVFVNDVEAKADKIGNFKATLTLDEGDNYILVFANDETGNYAQTEMTVTYEAK